MIYVKLIYSAIIVYFLCKHNTNFFFTLIPVNRIVFKFLITRFVRNFVEGISLIKGKRFISIILCYLLGFCLLLQTACDRNAEREPSEIRFWHNYTGKQEAVFKMLAETYNSTLGKNRGVRIVPVYKGTDEIAAYFLASFKQSEDSDYPEISVISNEIAYEAMCRSLIVSAESYLTGEALSGYFPDFLNEGRFTGKAETYIFPITKVSDITLVNDSLWRYFYSDNNADTAQWSTWKGIMDLARQYYDWSGGKALFALESVQDYIFTYSAQQLPAIIQAGNKEIKINTNKETLRAIWDFYYSGVVRGYILQTDDIQNALAAGDIMGYAGIPRDSSYFPKQFQNHMGGMSALLLSAMPYPSVNTSRIIAPQKGSGVAVFNHGDKINQECYSFLHWFCSNESIIQFSAENCEISSYKESYSEAVTKDYLNKLSLFDNIQYNMLSVSIDQAREGATYAPTGFIGYDSFCEELTASLVDAARRGRAEVSSLCEAGASYSAAVGRVDTDSAFETWYHSVVELASKY